ncbi:MAG: bifunctional pyr operon transcriptional regulator/uracil phosphoribosyltransferase PyrR [Actinomycetes bacterium]
MSTVLDSGDIARALKRISHEIVEHNHGLSNVTLMGIPTRGAFLAERIAAHLAEIELAPPVGIIDTTLYRDDLRMIAPKPLMASTLPIGGIEGRDIVLVDDVLFSGRTIRAALDALGDLGRPRTVQLAVLVDRGHRQLPIRADYVGKNLPTSASEKVRVCLREVDGEDLVEITGANK